MSHHRHEVHKRGKHRAEGGSMSGGHAEHELPVPAAPNPHIMKLAKERGNLGTIHGDPASSRLDRKRGGKAKHRAHGGKVGSDEHPYTSAGKHHKEPEGKHSYNHGAEEHKGHTHEGRK